MDSDDVGQLTPQQIISLCRKDLALFSWFFLPHHVNLKYGIPKFHLEAYDQYLKGHKRMVWIEPRGFAKTTRGSLIIPLHGVIYGYYKFIVIGSESFALASIWLNTIKDECETNERLKGYFGHFKPNKKYSGEGDSKWAGGDIVLSNGVRMLARGTGQRIRGLKHKQYRPDYIVIDDPESGVNASTPEQRAKNVRWLNAEVLPALDPIRGRILVTGNYIIGDCMTEKLYQASQEDRSTWVSIKNAAIKDDGTALWPTRFPLKKLEELRHDCESRGDYVTFEREYLNNPLPDVEIRFDKMDMRYWDGIILHSNDRSWIKVLDRGRYENKYNIRPTYTDQKEEVLPAVFGIGVDLAISETDIRDATVITVGARTQDGGTYICESHFLRTKQPSVIVEKIIEFVLYYRPKTIAIESNQFQVIISQELMKKLENTKRKHPEVEDCQVCPIVNMKKKELRIMRLQGLFKAGLMHQRRNHMNLEKELLTYPGTHDDGPDSLEMMDRYLKPAPEGQFTSRSNNERNSKFPNLDISFMAS